MAKINVTSGTASAYGQGELQLQNKAPMDSTLRPVTDSANTASPLNLSTSLVQTTSTLKITTNDNPYIDAEDGAGNNRFTVGRDTGSQQVNVDFASNPGGSTTIVGAIRTYVDGVTLSEVMTFREDGNIGINTLTPGAKLDIHSASNVIMQLNRTGAGKSWLQYLQAGTARWNTGYDNTNGNFTIYDAVAAADRMVVTNAGNVGIGTTSPESKLHVADSVSGGIVSVFVDNNINALNSTAQIKFTVDAGGSLTSGGAAIQAVNVDPNYANTDLVFRNTGNTVGNLFESMRITNAGNVGIGTSTPLALLHISQSGANTICRIGNNSAYDQFLYFNGGNDFSLGMDASNSNAFVLSNASTLGTNDRLVVTTAGNVGIGTSTPTTKLMVEGTGSFGTVSNEVRLQNAGTFVSSTLNAHLINSDGTGAYNSGNLLIQPRCSSGAGVTDIIFATSNNTNTPTERFRITANGVTFNGDTAAANALDDYEEGTWTPGITFGGATTGITYIENVGSYTKIGRQVTVNGYIALSSKGSATGSGKITGLPFTIPAGANRYATVSLWFNNVSFVDQYLGYGVINNTIIDINQITNAGALSGLSDTNFSNNSEVMINFTYFV